MTQKQKKYTVSIVGVIPIIVLVLFSTFYIADVFSQSQNIKIETQSNQATETHIITDPLWHEPVKVNKLKAESKNIVIGEPINNIGLRTQDSLIVKTLYSFKIDETIKGNLQNGEIIKIELPGGLVPRNDNSFLNVVTPGFKKMRNRQKYLIFLEKKPGQELMPTRGPQGIFEVTGNMVIPHGVLADRDRNNDNDKFDKTKFLKLIQEAKDEN